MDDAICCVLSSRRNIDIIYLVLNHYLPGYEQLPGYYCPSFQAPDLEFASEDEMLRYYVQQEVVAATFFWNKPVGNPNCIMVGATLTTDGGLVMSLTVPATQKAQEDYYLLELKNLLQSTTGLISYNQYPGFTTATAFQTLCANAAGQ